jgi:methionyl-tRNA formyltransferase
VKNIFIVTDNKHIYQEFTRIADGKKNIKVHYFCSPKSKTIFENEINSNLIKPIILKENEQYFINNFDVGFSCHSKQIFPIHLVNNVLCINIHPGLNPYNRGWYPQVFSIINELPAGATIHIMDEEIDHGDIIIQEEIIITSSDTSLSVYNKVQSKEIELLEKTFDSIIDGTFQKNKPISEGNYNSIGDYKKMCKIDLNQQVTMKQAIDFLRAMTHPPYKNCYFVDKNGEKVYVSIDLNKRTNDA